MNLFYQSDIPESGELLMNEEEARHCLSVLRMKKGDLLTLTNGKGYFFNAEIVEIGKNKCRLFVKSVVPDPKKRNYRLSIGIAPTKNIDRFEWFLEKATEIGCDEIIPILCEHSERKIIKPDRLERVMIAAMKQCLQSEKPELKPLITFKELITSISDSRPEKFICHIPELKDNAFPTPVHDAPKLLEKYLAGNNAIILIGPEGGFSPEEVRQAQEAGVSCVSLGNNRLRVETAGVVACSQIASLNNRTN